MSKTFKIQSLNISKLRHLLPRDNQFHDVFIADEEKTISVKNNDGKLYMQKVIYSELKPLIVASKQKQIKNYTVDFLKEHCIDFSELREMVDLDMKEECIEEERKGNRKESGEKRKENRKESGEKSRKIKKLWIPKTKKTRLIKGFMQSKKSWAIISLSFYYYLTYKMPVFIIVENKTNSCDQMIGRVKEMFKKYMKNSEFENVVKILDIKRGKKSTDAEVADAMNGKAPKIFISMRSEYDLYPVNETIEKSPLKRFVVIIDESDANDTLSDSSAQDELTRLKEMSSAIWDVTATALTSLMKEEIEAGNVFIMRRPEGYKDLHTFNMVKLKNAKCCDGVNDDPFEKDLNLEKYIKDFSRTKVYEVPFWDNQRHPVISLVKIGNPLQPQIKVANYIEERYSDRIVTITYNGTGITMRGDALPRESISSIIKSSYSKGVHTLGDVQVGEVICYLQENGGVAKFPRVMILAGKMAERGITFGSSNYSECIEKGCIPWHLTEMYYLASDATDQRNILQTPGRLCGVYKDNIPLTLYSNACDDIIKAYHMQEELISRARKMSTSMYMRDLIQSVHISKEKCAKRRVTPVNIPCRLKKVKDDKGFGGWDWEKEGRTGGVTSASFGKGKRPETEHKVLSEERILQIREEKRETDETKENEEHWKKLSTAYTRGVGKVKKIIELYIKEDFRSLSLSDLRNECGGVFQYDNYDHWNLVHGKYHIIDRISSGRYNIRTEVIEKLNLMK